MRERQKHQRRQLAGLVTGALAGIAVLLVLVALARLGELTEAIRESQITNRGSIELIEDCTTAGGKCFEESQQRTGNVIEVLNAFTSYVVACADEPGTQSAARIRACAIDALQESETP